MPRPRVLRDRWAVPVALLALLAASVATAGVASAVPAERHAAAVALYVAPGAAPGGNGSAQQPFATIDQARQPAHRLSADSDVVVNLAGGTYRQSEPLAFGSDDGGQNGHTISYQAGSGQQPVVTGAQQVTGWRVQDQTNNIWSVHVGTGVNTRQLYVNGKEAPRAAIPVSRSDFAFTQTGLTITNSALNYLSGLSDQNHMEVESLNSFTDRYAPVQSISGSAITMRQPAWNNNSWGYDTINAPFAGGTMYLENNYSFLRRAGQWYLNSSTGDLYYRAQPGQNPGSLDIELPRLQSLLGISGSSGAPATGLRFTGIRFTGTSWLGPSGSNGYADQQSGAHITGAYPMPADWLNSCKSGCPQFEATRNHWAQMPAAVQVSAATGITFSGDTFSELGKAGLGVGNDGSATASGTGLGASGITITGNTFTDDSTFSGNWYNGGNTYVATGSPHNNVLTGNVQVSGTNWPQGAQLVIQQAGLQSDGSYAFQNQNSGLCLDVHGAGNNLGQQFDQWPCKNTAGTNQDFTPR
ncbi:RICIN domain-containing protein [Streptomyces sp. NPDC051994]|uniref:RICIN domain-containing protein n=1 Tax=unclassified Streptomyces TaxID=2593676 RepID=UPI00344A7A2A